MKQPVSFSTSTNDQIQQYQLMSKAMLAKRFIKLYDHPRLATPWIWETNKAINQTKVWLKAPNLLKQPIKTSATRYHPGGPMTLILRMIQLFGFHHQRCLGQLTQWSARSSLPPQAKQRAKAIATAWQQKGPWVTQSWPVEEINDTTRHEIQQSKIGNYGEATILKAVRNWLCPSTVPLIQSMCLLRSNSWTENYMFLNTLSADVSIYWRHTWDGHRKKGLQPSQ